MSRHSTILAAATMLAASFFSTDAAADEFVAHRLFVVSAIDAQLHSYGGNQPILDRNGNAVTTGVFAADADLGFFLGGNPSGEIAFAPDGTLYVTALPKQRVYAFDGEGQLVRALGEGVADFLPASIAFGPDGNAYVGNAVGDQPIVEFDSKGAFVRRYGPTGSVNITGLAFDPANHLYASCYQVNRVKELDASGKLVKDIGVNVLVRPRGLAFGPDGLLYVASSGAHEIVAFDHNGQVVKVLGAGVLNTPIGVAFGPDGRLYVSSYASDTITVFDGLEETSGAQSFGHIELDGPLGIGFAPTRILATVRGLVVNDGDVLGQVRQNALVSVSPASPRIMLSFDDPEGFIATNFGSTWAVFQGFGTFNQPEDKIRMLYGSQIALQPIVDGTASMAMLLFGNLREDDVWSIRRTSGTMHLATPQAIWNARFSAGRVIN